MPRYSSTVRGGGKRRGWSVISSICSGGATLHSSEPLPRGHPHNFHNCTTGIPRTRHLYYSKFLVSSSGSLAMLAATRRAWSLVNLNGKLVSGRRPLIDQPRPLSERQSDPGPVLNRGLEYRPSPAETVAGIEQA